MTNTSGQTPEPLDFAIPDASGAPSRASAPYWAAWRGAEARAASERAENTRLNDQFQADNSQLKDEIRAIDIEKAALAERVCSLEHHNRLVATFSTSVLALAGIMGGLTIYFATENPPNHGVTVITAGLTALLLLVGACVAWLPDGRRRTRPRAVPLISRPIMQPHGSRN